MGIGETRKEKDEKKSIAVIKFVAKKGGKRFAKKNPFTTRGGKFATTAFGGGRLQFSLLKKRVPLFHPGWFTIPSWQKRIFWQKYGKKSGELVS